MIKIFPQSLLLLTLLACSPSWVMCQDQYLEGAQKPDVWTPQVFPVGNPTGYPFIELNTAQQLHFHFDIPGTSRDDYRYAVIHCTRNWKRTDIESSEYLRGFAQLPITEVEASFGTQLDYVHYQFQFPNDMMVPTLSGNYAVVAFSGMDPDDRESWLMVWRVVVYESRVRIGARLQQSQVVRDRFTHHEIMCDVIPGQYRIPDPSGELRLTILQNGDWHHAVEDIKPVFIRPDAISFQYSDGRTSLPAGNEWRDFEMKDLRFNGIQVETVMPSPDGYHVYLRPGMPSGIRGAHETRPDLNGRLFVRSDIATDSQLEAEYVIVHFTLQIPPFAEADVRIEGDLSRYSSRPWTMQYDESARSYRFSQAIKQGFYNYRYVVYDRYHPAGDWSVTEGNFSATENDYHVLVYHYDRASGADRLVGIEPLNSHR
ncbi:MAG: type IX secretion system plug protein domain-containing protein [Flavobacteriales bacterium]